MSYLTWISDEALTEAVTKLVSSVTKAAQKAGNNISRNGLDPFSLLFNISLISRDVESWKKSEILRQTEKGLSNALGIFHQDIISHVKGWEDPGSKQDFDLVNHEKRIIVEMKNKHNTLNAEGKKSCFEKLSNAVSNKSSRFYQYAAYCVNIVPCNNRIGATHFTVKNNSKDSYLKDEKVFLIDGASFYTLATGKDAALKELLDVLPLVLKDSNKIDKIDPKVISYINEIFKKTYNRN